MRVHFKQLCAAVLLVLALQPLYLLALVATDYVAPPDLRRERLKKIPPPNDDTVECVALGIGLQPGGTGLHNAIMAARPLGEGTPCDALPAAAAGSPTVSWLPYPRYWHGYRVVLDPLTAWFSLYSTRYVMLAALIAALTWFAFELRYLVGYDAALAVIAPTVILTDLWRNWAFTAQTLAIVVVFAGSAVAARKARRLDSNLILVAAVFGSLFNYVDFLINPPWQPMLIAFVALAAGRRLAETFVILAAWSMGYALTWASKWGLACAAGASWSDIFEVITYRLNGEAPGYVSHRLLAPSHKVLTYLYQQTQPAMVFLILLPTLLLPVRWPNLRRFALLASPALIPFAWFEILSNHSQIHAWMVYRPVASCIGILIAAAIIASRENLLPLQAGHRQRDDRDRALQQKSAG